MVEESADKEKMCNGIIYRKRDFGQESFSYYNDHRLFCGDLLSCTGHVHVSFWSTIPSSKSDLLKLVEERNNG